MDYGYHLVGGCPSLVTPLTLIFGLTPLKQKLARVTHDLRFNTCNLNRVKGQCIRWNNICRLDLLCTSKCV